MKKQARYLFSIIFLCVFSIFIDGCKKKKHDQAPVTSATQDIEIATLSQFNIIQYHLNDITNIGAQVSETGALNFYESLSSTASVTIINKVITVDYGLEDSRCWDGQLRSGKLIFDFSNSTNNATSFKMPGFELNVTSENYIINKWSVTINKKKITNISPLSISGQTLYTGVNLIWSDSMDVTILTHSLTEPYSIKGTHMVELLNTNDINCYNGQAVSLIWNKAKVQINGSYNGSFEYLDGTHTKDNFVSNVNNLIRDFKCLMSGYTINRNPFISGNIIFIPGSKRKCQIDYGNGSCDPDYYIGIVP